MNWIKLCIYLLIFLICFFVFRIIFSVLSGMTTTREELGKSIDTRFKKKRVYSRQRRKLSQYGIMYFFDDFDLSPAKYMALRVFVGLITAVFSIALMERVHLLITPLALIGGYFLCDILFRLKNKSDNEDMLQDIFNIYLTLKIQLASDVYIIDALQSCRDIIRHKRLRIALDELLANASDKGKSYNEAIDTFKNRFYSEEITNLCSFLRSYARFGVTEKYLADILSEINEISNATSMKEEHNIDTKVGLINFLFFTSIIATIAYGVFMSLGTINFF